MNNSAQQCTDHDERVANIKLSVYQVVLLYDKETPAYRLALYAPKPGIPRVVGKKLPHETRGLSPRTFASRESAIDYIKSAKFLTFSGLADEMWDGNPRSVKGVVHIVIAAEQD